MNKKNVLIAVKGYLIEVLVNIALNYEKNLQYMSPAELKLHHLHIEKLVAKLPPLPDFSYFHKKFNPHNLKNGESKTRDGLIRDAYMLAYDQENCEYINVVDGTLSKVFFFLKKN